MYYTLTGSMRITAGLLLLVGLMVCGPPAARAQDKGLPFLPAPPPMKSVTREERTQLSAARDNKARVRATIELAEVRLVRAEQLTAGQHYDAASAELGGYQGLLENLMRFLDESEPRKNKIRDVYKRLEMALRAHSTRLESIRRLTPTEYAVNVKAIADYASDARDLAINSFYGNTVMTDADERLARPSTEQTSKDFTPPARPPNQP